MIGTRMAELDTPSLIIDLDRLESNIDRMQTLADTHRVQLRPHIKTHKMADIANMQIDRGACGITVAKISEAEVMARAGVKDIFIATEIVGEQKLKRVRSIAGYAKIRIAVDSMYHVEQIADHFAADTGSSVELMVEIDTGLGRCGVKPRSEAAEFIEQIIKRYPHLPVAGIFTHEGMAYHAKDNEQLVEISSYAQTDMIDTGKLIEGYFDHPCEISMGCSLAALGGDILPGITEIRPGTYVFFDSQHARFLGHTDYCAASVLSTVTSKRGTERVVADAGAKSVTIDQKASGICTTQGFGIIKSHENLTIARLSDEHAVIVPGSSLEINERIEIIPNHICPTVNLYDRAYGVRNGLVERVFEITARGCTQ